ncbi:MAG: hypothetical protein FJ122_10060, partial [Deltaproteobacteria bacterium]|nr:hypothetical protein [Deltaproteobacteria bacterium]
MNTITTALITLSFEGAKLLAPLAAALPGARLYIHESVRDESIREGLGGVEKDRRGSARASSTGEAPGLREAERFTRIADLTASLFPVCRGLVYAAPCGVVVRALAPLIRSKHE